MNSIFRFFLAFEHAQLAPLLDPVVQMAPETLEILSGGDQSADHDEPKEDERQRL
jgi:hypothetical protein